MRKGLVIILLLALTTSVSAQTQPEYRVEIGAGVGMVTYLGDFNGNLLKNPMPMFSLLAKYKLDPRMAVAMNVSYGKIKGHQRMPRHTTLPHGRTIVLTTDFLTWG